jgi:hypothetical protein
MECPSKNMSRPQQVKGTVGGSGAARTLLITGAKYTEIERITWRWIGSKSFIAVIGSKRYMEIRYCEPGPRVVRHRISVTRNIVSREI